MSNLYNFDIKKLKIRFNPHIRNLSILALLVVISCISTPIDLNQSTSLGTEHVQVPQSRYKSVPPVKYFDNLRIATASAMLNEPPVSKRMNYMLNYAMSSLIMMSFLMMPCMVAAAPGIKHDDLNKFKIIMAVNTVGREVLLTTYQKYYEKFPDGMNIKDYLMKDHKKSEAQFKKEFNNNQSYIDAIENTPPSGEKYDTSLLFQCINVLRKINEPTGRGNMTLFDKCKKLKDKRNETFHSFSGICDSDMKKQIKEIKEISMDILDCLEHKSLANSAEVKDKKNKLSEEITKIEKQPLSDKEKEDCRLEDNLEFLKNEIPSYKTSCEKWGKINFLEFISPKSDTSGDIDLLFTDVIIKPFKGPQTEIAVACEDIIKQATASRIVLLNSDPGGGKSTIMQRSIYEFGKDGTKMNTNRYNLIFPMIFRAKHLLDVGALIGSLINGVKDKMGNEDIKKCIVHNSLPILFYCDGWDERNDASTKLFQDICNLKIQQPNIDIIVTSRPVSVRKLIEAVELSNLNVSHLEVRGILEDKRKEFLSKYHQLLVNDDKSKAELLQFYENCSARIKELYRLPLNLVLLSWLWGQDSKSVRGIKSEAGLYEQILKILVDEKLVDRISEAKTCRKGRMFTEDLFASIDKFNAQLYKASLESLSNDSIYIDKKGVDSLKDVCKEEALEFNEFLAACLMNNDEWKLSGNPDDNEKILKIAHKGIMEYFGAKRVESMILQGKRVKEILEELHTNDPSKYDSKKYQNVVTILGGVLALNKKHPKLVDNHGQDIIDFLKEAGNSKNEEWYTVYSNLCSTDSAPGKFGPLIAKHLDKNNFTIKEGEVEVLSTLLEHVDDISEVTLDIRSYDNLPEFPTLLKVLKSKKHKIILKNITIQADSLTFSNDPQINSNEVSLFTPTNL